MKYEIRFEVFVPGLSVRPTTRFMYRGNDLFQLKNQMYTVERSLDTVAFNIKITERE